LKAAKIKDVDGRDKPGHDASVILDTVAYDFAEEF